MNIQTHRQTDTRTALLYLYVMSGVNLSFRPHFRHEDDLVAKCRSLLFSCLWSNEDFEVSHDPLRWSLYFRFALWEPEISTSGQKKIVENLPRNHINKTIFWIFDILSRYGEIGEQTDTQTDTHTDILTLFIWDVSSGFKVQPSFSAWRRHCSKML